MGNSINELFYQTISEFQPCECCRIRYTSSTATTSTPHKWTKKEIESMVLELAKAVAESNWFTRGDKRRALKHWTDKLQRYNEAKEEFK